MRNKKGYEKPSGAGLRSYFDRIAAELDRLRGVLTQAGCTEWGALTSLESLASTVMFLEERLFSAEPGARYFRRVTLFTVRLYGELMYQDGGYSVVIPLRGVSYELLFILVQQYLEDGIRETPRSEQGKISKSRLKHMLKNRGLAVESLDRHVADLAGEIRITNSRFDTGCIRSDGESVWFSPGTDAVHIVSGI